MGRGRRDLARGKREWCGPGPGHPDFDRELDEDEGTPLEDVRGWSPALTPGEVTWMQRARRAARERKKREGRR